MLRSRSLFFSPDCYYAERKNKYADQVAVPRKNRHSPFQIDGNFGGTAGITEMLLQSHMGFIQLLPALPDAWKEGSVSGICAKGNFEVAMVWENNQLKEAVVHSNAGGNCVIKYADKTLSFKTVKGRSYRVEYDVTKGLIRQ